MTKQQLNEIVQKTDGHCHFCGDKVSFERRGCRSDAVRRGVVRLNVSLWDVVQQTKGMG